MSGGPRWEKHAVCPWDSTPISGKKNKGGQSKSPKPWLLFLQKIQKTKQNRAPGLGVREGIPGEGDAEAKS